MLSEMLLKHDETGGTRTDRTNIRWWRQWCTLEYFQSTFTLVSHCFIRTWSDRN